MSPSRTAHALHALLCTVDDIKGPASAAEVVIYDEESLSARGTAQALRAGARRGLCFNTNGFWWTTNELYENRTALEERFLIDTERDE
jgi:hypothetical protein